MVKEGVNGWYYWWPLEDSNLQPKDYESGLRCFTTFPYPSLYYISPSIAILMH